MTRSPDPPATSNDAPLETLEAATAYLDGLINRERRTDYAYRRLDLAPIQALLEDLGRPDQALSIVHVAGSKGKGSTCLLAEALLLELGERVGTFTSPHLESWRERFRIDGELVGKAALVAAVERVRPIVERLRVGPERTRPSFFDATTAVALLLFAEAGVDRALVEVGLGGRLDSTNAVSPAVTCVTSIELEHTDKLGDTEAAIAGEKAGILKPGVPAVMGALRPEARAVVRGRAEAVGAPIVELGRDFDVETGHPSTVASSQGESRASPGDARARFSRPGLPPFEVAMATPGVAARQNAALALACVLALETHPADAVEAAARRAFATCRLPGRIERLEQDPRVIVDAAHTTRSARVLADALLQMAPGGHDLLLSVSEDKNIDALLGALLPDRGRVWVTRADPFRSLAPEVLAERVRTHARTASAEIEIRVESDPELACRLARKGLAEGRVLCACGSVYLAGIARRVLGTEAPSGQSSSG
jgi:dihydrofolate synthase/folylpolyglutamate synthase